VSLGVLEISTSSSSTSNIKTPWYVVYNAILTPFLKDRGVYEHEVVKRRDNLSDLTNIVNKLGSVMVKKKKKG